jgi:hypothetical protein
MTADRTANIQAQYATLRTTPVADLRQIYKQSHRVCDLRGVDKQSLITGILIARHGSKAVEIAFA